MPICPTCSSSYIENGRCGVCDTPVSGAPPAVGRPEPAPRPPVRQPQEIPFTDLSGPSQDPGYTIAVILDFQAELRKRMMAVEITPRKSGKQVAGSSAVKKYGVVLPPDAYEAIKMLPGGTGQNIEKAIRWWVSVFGEGSKE